MIKLNLPDFVANKPFYGAVVHMAQDYPEILRENTRIASVFGSFPWCVWNGGGLFRGYMPYMREQMEETIAYYNYDLHIPLRFTFTNPVLTEMQLNDTYANIIAEVAHNGHNEILVTSPILEKYLRQNYPNYKYCRSIIGSQNSNLEYINDYDLVVLQRKMNNDWDTLNSIPMELRPKVELLCTDPCPVDCPRIYSHYRDFGRATIEYKKNAHPCSMDSVKGLFPQHYMHQLPVYLSWERIAEEYAPKGFTQFKISGRGTLAGALFAISDYLIKPEYKNDMIAMGIDLLMR